MNCRVARRISSFLLAALMLAVCAWPSNAYAGTADNGDVTFAVSTDKSEYAAGEQTQVVLEATNNSTSDMEDVFYRIEIPDSMSVNNPDLLIGSFGAIAPGETKNYELSVVVNEKGFPVQGDPVTNTPNSGTTGTEASNSSEGAQSLAATGDSPAGVIVTVAIVGLAAAALIASSKARKVTLSVILAVGLAGTVSFASLRTAFADAQQTEISASATVLAGGEEGTIKAFLTYTLTNAGGSEGGSGPDSEDIPEGIVLKDGVIEVDPESWSPVGDDLLHATIDPSFDEPIGVGDTVALMPNNVSPTGASIVVTRVTYTESGCEIEGTQAAYEDVVESINISGTTAEAVSFEPAEGVTLVEDEPSTASARIAIGDTVDFEGEKWEIADGCTVAIKPSITYDIETKWLDLRKCELSANVDATFDFDYSDTTELINKPLGKATYTTPVGVSIGVDFYVIANATGELDVHAETSVDAGVKYVDDNWEPFFEVQDPKFEGSFSAQLQAGVRPDVILGFLNIGIADFGIETGGVLRGEMIAHTPDFVCADLSIWLYTDATVGYSKGTFLNLIGVSKRIPIITEENSPKWSKHVENGVVVPECTWDGEDEPGGDDDAEAGGDGESQWPDEGYGTVPILDELTGASSYYNKLVEPFYVYEGNSFTAGPYAGGAIFVDYEAEPGSVVRITRMYSDGTSSVEVTCYPYGPNWHIYGAWKVEVLKGRITVDDITAWTVPPVSLRTCEVVDYPLHISDTEITMKVGESREISAWDDYAALGDTVSVDEQYQWNAGYDIGLIESEDAKHSSAVVTAQHPGTYTVTVRYEFAEATCTVTVVE